MTNRTELYKCEICGNIVEVKHTGAPALVCCGEKMKLLKENTTDAEKITARAYCNLHGNWKNSN
jgi:superoxide reductase